MEGLTSVPLFVLDAGLAYTLRRREMLRVREAERKRKRGDVREAVREREFETETKVDREGENRVESE